MRYNISEGQDSYLKMYTVNMNFTNKYKYFSRDVETYLTNNINKINNAFSKSPLTIEKNILNKFLYNLC